MKTIEEKLAVKIIPEILDEVRACTTKEEMRDVLLANQSPAFRQMIQYVFYPTVQFTITELPKFTPDPGPIGLSPNSLFSEMRRLYTLLEATKLPIAKKSEILVGICESVHPSEAALLGLIIQRDLGIPLFNYDNVREIFPDLLPA